MFKGHDFFFFVKDMINNLIIYGTVTEIHHVLGHKGIINLFQWTAIPQTVQTMKKWNQETTALEISHV